MLAQTIDDVIELLEEIIQDNKHTENPLGYFAALYQKVTISVKEKLNTNYFDDDERMEKLDVLFANRYLLAYSNYKQNLEITKSWQVVFDLSSNDNLIVLQHLLLGMNAHINLDLGIAAAQISNSNSIDDLYADFCKINDILSDLVEDIQSNLSKIWPLLLRILKFFNKVDDFVIAFSMNLARDGAWKFANELLLEPDLKRDQAISIRDKRITEIAKLVTEHKRFVRIIFKIVRLSELGSVSSKIDTLKKLPIE